MFLRNAAMLDTFGVTVTATESSDVYGAADTDIKANAKSYDVITGNAYTTAAPRIQRKTGRCRAELSKERSISKKTAPR